MVTFGDDQSMQEGMKSMIDKLRVVIENLEADLNANQAVYEDFVYEMKAKLEQRIKEVKDRVKI